DRVCGIVDFINIPAQRLPCVLNRRAVLRAGVAALIGRAFKRSTNRDDLGVVCEQGVEARPIPSIERLDRGTKLLDIRVRHLSAVSRAPRKALLSIKA